MRLFAFIVAVLLAWAGMGHAQAQDCSGQEYEGGTPPGTFPTRQDAYAACLTHVGQTQMYSYVVTWTRFFIATTTSCDLVDGTAYQRRETETQDCGNAHSAWDSRLRPGLFSWSQECPAGKHWNEATKKCDMACPGGFGEDPYSPGQCLDEDKCTSRNSSVDTKALRMGGDTCVDTGGCAFEADQSSSLAAATSVASMTLYAFSYSGRPGSACGTPPSPDPPPPPKPECIQAPGNQTVCVRPDGQHCYSSAPGVSSGHCWQPGETGEQNNGPDRQKRDAGTEPIPPNLNLPNGDTLTPKPGGPVTTTTTTNNTTTTTVVVNYTTTNGTNAGGGSGSGDKGTGDITNPGGGGNDTGGGSGTGNGDGTSASGGTDCKTPPVVQGDAALNMVSKQAWETRCAVEAANAAKVTGNINDCKQPFTVEGTNANAVKLRAMRKQVCPMEGETMTSDGGEGAEEGDTDVFGEGTTVDGSSLDSGGWTGAGGSCPGLVVSANGNGPLSSGFMTHLASPPPAWCQFVSWAYFIVVTFATVTGIFIIGGFKGS